MAKQTVKSGLAGKFGNRLADAHEQSKGKETKYSAGGDLPEGIENGIAQLTMCKFGVFEQGDNEGEYYFMAAGTVVLPLEHAGLPIQGLRTQIGPEPLCDTPNRTRKTFEEHYDWILNELRKLGLDTTEFDYDEIETAAEALQDAAPHFRFRTWKGKPTEQFPNPRVNHQWNGQVDYNPESNGSAQEHATEDNTEEVEENPKPKRKKASKPKKEEHSEEDAITELRALGEAADNKDESAARKLDAQAKLFGIDSESVATWADVAEAIVAKHEEESKETEPENTFANLGNIADTTEGEEGDNAVAKLREAAEKAGIDENSYETWEALGEYLDG